MEIEDLPNMSTTELAAALADWKRWRSRVCHAPVMRLRQERFAQANAFIAAIEDELEVRSPHGRYLRYRQALTTVRELESEATVSLSAYRAAQRDLERIVRRISP